MPGYDEEFSQLRAAKAWGLTPRQWRLCSEDDKALMMAFEGFEAVVAAYREEHRERKRDEKRNGGRTNDFKRMKQRMGLNDD